MIMIMNFILKCNIKRLIMKKIIAISGAALMIFAACNKNDMPSSLDPSDSGLVFMASVESPQSKVLTSAGKSTWEEGDEISLFSVAAGAEAGVAEGVNVIYRAASAGATTEFVQVDELVGRSDKYYAFFPASPSYVKLNANESIDFGGAANGAEVTDYRFMPVAINSGTSAAAGVECTYDAETGKVSTNQTPYFYASAVAPSEEGEPVNLVFKPILPVIEFGLKGKGTVKNMVVEYADKETDELDNDSNKWLTGKGVFNLSTGVFTTTNTASPAYGRLYVDLKSTDNDYIQLNNETPIYFQLVVGRFEITQGLKLTFTDKDGNEFEKIIWTDKTYKGMSDAGNPKFISQVVNVPYKEVEEEGGDVEYDPEAYYEVDMAKIDWTASYVHNVTAGENVMAVITKEFFGATVNKQGVVAYKAAAGAADYTDGKVLQVTLDGDAAPTGDVHGGSLSAWTTAAASVTYTAGMSPAIEKIYVKGDGSEILTAAPSAEVLEAELVPYILTSTSGQEHPLVKIGNRFWTACSYKTTKQIDGTSLTEITTGRAPASGSVVYTSESKGIWLYNGNALGFNASDDKFTNKIAPEGWTLPTMDDWKSYLPNFLGNTTMYDNMSTALLFDRLPYIVKTNATIKQLAYYGIWSCEPTTDKMHMLKCDPNTAPTSSAQSYLNMFETRLVSKN